MTDTRKILAASPEDDPGIIELGENLGKLPAQDASDMLTRLARHQMPVVAHRAGELLRKTADAANYECNKRA